MAETSAILTTALVQLADHLRAEPPSGSGPLALVDPASLDAGDGRLADLARRCELAPVEVDLLVIAAAAHLDRDFGALFAAAGGDPGASLPTVGLALGLLGRSLLDPEARALVGPGSALRRHRLLRLREPDRPLPARLLDVPERVIHHLLGGDDMAPRPARIRVPLIPVAAPTAFPVARALEAGALVHLRERPRGSARGLAAAAIDVAGLDGFAVDLAQRGSDAVDEVLEDAVLEAVLTGAVLVVGPTEAGPIEPRHVELLGAAPCSVVLHGGEGLPEAGPVQHQLRVDVEPTDRPSRLATWATVLAGCGLDVPGDLAPLGAVPLAPERVLHAALIAEVHAVAEDRPMTVDDLVLAARSQGDSRLEALAQVIRPTARFDDLVVTGLVRTELQRVVTRVRQQHRVRTEWGLEAVAGHGRGVTALFAGPSGTGKTLSAEALAGELGVELYVVDLSTIVDKYVGETEKNLERVFSAAESQSGVLFFDEADALFGKRSEVRDAHDRFANIEVAYLLQRIERFDGVAVMATNQRANLDDAFARRLDVIIVYDEPEEDARLALWRRHLPESAPLANDVDLPLLAKAIPLTGGVIRNICLDAAFCAADDGTDITMAQLVRSTGRSQLMAGRLLDASAFGEWADCLKS